MKKSLEAVVGAPTDFSRHRSMIKRVQLVLTLLSRIANSLNEDNLQLEDFSVAEEYQKTVENKQPINKLTSKESCMSNFSSFVIGSVVPHFYVLCCLV